MKNKIVFINFWPKGGMRHYSDATVKILKNENNIIYYSNYKTSVDVSNKIFNFSLNLLNFTNYFALVSFVSKLIKDKPKVIHINSGYPILFPIYPLFYFFNSIVTVHDAIPHKGEKIIKIIFHKIQLICFSLFFKKIIVHSENIKNELPKFVPKKKIYVIPHIGYSHLFEKGIQNKKIEKFTVLFFGRILEYKGLSYLVDAFKNLEKEKFELIIAGEGEINFSIKESNIKIENRFINDNEISSFFSLADVVVLPYTSASQSGVIYLSFAYNKPVIVTNTGSLSEVVENNVTGIIIKPGSSLEICEAIKKISEPIFYNKIQQNIKIKNLNSDSKINYLLNLIYNK